MRTGYVCIGVLFENWMLSAARCSRDEDINGFIVEFLREAFGALLVQRHMSWIDTDNNFDFVALKLTCPYRAA